MPQIQVKFDNTLSHSEVIIPIIGYTSEESSKYIHNRPEVLQTAVYGIHAPLIMVNNIVVDVPDVLAFSLSLSGRLPSVKVHIRDRYNLLTSLDTPGLDNELRVQILPQFENKYKKINLTFYISSVSINNGELFIAGSYKLPKFTSSQIKSFGEINTYTLFETIAKETGLGFATNVEPNDEDKRWIYCNCKSYLDLLDYEISMSGSEGKIYDWWIDPWNNLNLVDVYDRYTHIDPADDMKLWVSCQNGEVSGNVTPEPIEIAAVLNNHPINQSSELFVVDYNISTNPGVQMGGGTDRVFSIYNSDCREYLDTLIQDGDSHKDIFYKYAYLGEVYGEYNYLLSAIKRETFFQKINSNEKIAVCLRTPLLGILRGNKINFAWYVNDSNIDIKMGALKDAGIVNEPETNIPFESTDWDSSSNVDQFVLDKSISGQYMIASTQINFSNGRWNHMLSLCRPSSQKPKMINDEESKSVL